MALRRDTARLRAAASAVAADLAATLGGEWVCRVSDDYVLTLGDRGRAEEVLLDANVDEAGWPAEAFVGEYREPTLDDDANEVVAEEVREVLRAWDVMWPVCPAHGGVLTACSGVWVCGRTPSHDVAAVGSLGAVVGRRPDSGSGHS